MSPELIGAVTTGLTGLIAALAAYSASRSRRVASDVRSLRRQVKFLRRQVVAAVAHIHEQDIELARHGITPPPWPAILDADDPELADDTAPAPPARGQHERT